MHALAAFGAGAGAGALAEVALDAARTGHAPPALAVATIALLSGAALAVVSTAGAALSARAASWTTGGAVGLALAAQALYVANVHVLKAWPMRHPVSLAVDALLVLGCVALATGVATRPLTARLARAAAAPLAALGLVALLGAGAVLAARWPSPGADARGTANGPNLVLFYLDSVRADRVLAPREGGPVAPELDAWAAGARVYRDAWSNSSWTAPSVNRTMLPHRGPLPPGQTLAEALSARGYTTACFSDNPHLTRAAEFLRGFHRIERSVAPWRLLFRGTFVADTLDAVAPGSDAALVDRALRWARSVDGPFFLYVHLMDAHAPYRFPPIDRVKRGGRHLTSPYTGMTLTDEERADVIARYDGGVRETATQAARALRGLEEVGPLVAIVSADHGESLGEGERWFHGGSLAPELLRVPFLVAGEGVAPGTVDDVVGADSVAWTLLAAAGAPDLAGAPRDLRTGRGDGTAEGTFPPDAAFRVRGGHRVLTDAKGPTRLYDVVADPGEQRDLAAERPDLAADLAEGLEAGAAPAKPPDELEEQLKALGYLE